MLLASWSEFMFLARPAMAELLMYKECLRRTKEEDEARDGRFLSSSGSGITDDDDQHRIGEPSDDPSRPKE